MGTDPKDRKKTHLKLKKVYLLGSGIGKSISPAIHKKAFRELGLDLQYSLSDVPDSDFRTRLNEFVKDKDVVGFNVTIPYKEKILPLMARLELDAKAVGAVNVVTFDQDRKMIGHNTDIDGVVASLSKLGLIGRTGQRAVILGAGGASRACVYALFSNGFDEVKILNRTKDRAKEVAHDFLLQFPHKKIEFSELTKVSFEDSMLDKADLLINTIPFLAVIPFDLNFSLAPKSMKYFDINYRRDPPILKSAREEGLITIDGLLMIVEQAAKSFEIWTGISAPRKTMMLTARKRTHR
ncbi:MAG TPA: shikimate dehydrogenase [Nitrososphaerales archaeon]|nr:shikimate dehydrogenase [Nitrososphaerales archaeon]